MNIIETEIIDRNVFTDSTGYKIFLMDKIVDHFAPLFVNEIERKKNQLTEHEADYEKLRTDISRLKNELKLLLVKIKTESVKREIMVEIQYLNNYDVLYGRNKQIVKDILLTINSQDDYSLKESLGTLKELVKNNINK